MLTQTPGVPNSDRSHLPLGSFRIPYDDKWSQDKTTKYFQGFENRVLWPTLKSLLLIGLVTALRLAEWEWKWVTLICLALVGSYQHLVVLLSKDLVFVPSMD
jgi:hypothetical protein